MIQVKLFTDFTVIAFGRFFQTLQVGIQGFFICPCSTINTLQHLVIAVATPVCPCGLHQFEVMAETHVRHVRATAHIDIFFMMVQARLVIMGNVFIKNGDFIGLATLHEGFTRFVPADFLLNDIVVFLSELVHPLLERVDVFLG